MKKHQVLDTYDDGYAAAYDRKFHGNPASDREIEIVRQLLGAGPWLDVACGSGYVLGHFPGVARGGLDVAPAMLKLAKDANPDALVLREGSFLDDIEEWYAQWDLVTCMWYAYCLVESMSEVERVIANLARWTSDAGTCFVPLCNPLLLVPNVYLPYRTPDYVHGGTITISAVTWSWKEESGKEHQNMVAPQIEHMVAIFSRSFDSVDLIKYPLGPPGQSPERTAVIARRPRRTD